jgi:hypothetical protein
MTPTPSFRDVEKLSAYLDGQLKPSEVARLEARLKTDPELASVLKDLRETRGVLRQLPQRRAPRNFTLTPKMVGLKPPMPRTYPVFRFATVLATLLLFFTFATNFMAPLLTQTAASVPYGIGGAGGGGGAEEPELAMEAPLQDLAEPAEPTERAEMAAPVEEPAEEALEAPAMEEPPAPEAPAPAEGEPALAGTPAPEPTFVAPAAEDSARAEPTPVTSEKTGEGEAIPEEPFAQQAVPDEEITTQQPTAPFSSTSQIVLAGIAILSAIIAFIVRYSTIRQWRAKAK